MPIIGAEQAGGGGGQLNFGYRVNLEYTLLLQYYGPSAVHNNCFIVIMLLRP